MGRTTIEIPEWLKEDLRDERLEHETSYADTIARLMDKDDTGYVSVTEAREIANEQITERVVTEAQR